MIWGKDYMLELALLLLRRLVIRCTAGEPRAYLQSTDMPEEAIRG